MYRPKVFPSFANAAESARWIAQKSSSDVVVRAVDDDWILEIDALRKIEEAILRDLMAVAISQRPVDVRQMVDQSREWPEQTADPDVFDLDGEPAEAINDQWIMGEPDRAPDSETEASASG